MKKTLYVVMDEETQDFEIYSTLDKAVEMVMEMFEYEGTLEDWYYWDGENVHYSSYEDYYKSVQEELRTEREYKNITIYEKTLF